MNRSRQSLLIAMFLAICTPSATAEIEASDYTQTRIAEIFSLDMAAKTAVISGYRYSFTGTKGWDLPEIRMLGSSYGSFETLRAGMKVRVRYRLSKSSRVVVDMEQVTNDARLGIPDDIEP